jgi:hypothetical protein
LAALQRLLAEQNHLLQEHRQQLAALIDRASRPAPAPAASSPKPDPAPKPLAAVGPAPNPLTAAAAPRPATAPPPSWNHAAAVQRPLHTTQVMADSPSFWSRLGRGFFNSFSPAYKD